MSSISILLVVSAEAFHLKRGVRDLERARALAVAEGHRVIVSVLPFRTSEGTRAWLAEHTPAAWQVLPEEAGDLSFGIAAWASASDCDRLGVLGPDESVAARWLAACAALPLSGQTARHPEAVVTYGPNFFDRGEMSLLTLPPRVGRLGASAKANPLPASFVAPREVLLAHPYPCVDAARGWGQAGWTPLMRWWWVNRLLVAGVEFEAVPGAIHFRAMPDGEGPDTLLTPGDAQLMGPYLHVAPEPAATPRFQGWRMPERPGGGRTMLRERYQRDMEKQMEYAKQLEAARDFWKANSDAWEKAATAYQKPLDPSETEASGARQGISAGELEASLAHANALRQAYLEDRDRWQARAEHFEAAYRAGLPHRIKASVKQMLGGPLGALRRGRDRS
jgi:hypothetical protein